ncbi:MAG: helix-turn-helix transcriptional regulator [Candidatus Aenigmarchaeota archaeon]|nr:helix-turn-helix transcriptional regulator [Candidatus Aenigmarchaeota archaeon]
MPCNVVETSHIIGKKWSVPIIEEIAFGRFDGFNMVMNKMNDITPRTLSLHLQELEKSGIIKKRSIEASNKGNTRYVLTKKGRELHGIISHIKDWNVKWGKVPENCVKIPCTECPNFS